MYLAAPIRRCCFSTKASKQRISGGVRLCFRVIGVRGSSVVIANDSEVIWNYASRDKNVAGLLLRRDSSEGHADSDQCSRLRFREILERLCGRTSISEWAEVCFNGKDALCADLSDLVIGSQLAFALAKREARLFASLFKAPALCPCCDKEQ